MEDLLQLSNIFCSITIKSWLSTVSFCHHFGGSTIAYRSFMNSVFICTNNSQPKVNNYQQYSFQHFCSHSGCPGKLFWILLTSEFRKVNLVPRIIGTRQTNADVQTLINYDISIHIKDRHVRTDSLYNYGQIKSTTNENHYRCTL